MAVTRDDVAAAAGVSPAVVSYVINNGPRPVSPSTRARVMAAVERLGYRPDGRARSLRTRRSGSLGLVVPDASNPFFAELSRAIEDAAYAAGLAVLVCNSADDVDREQRYIRGLAERRVDGLILISARVDQDLADLLDLDIPIIAMDRAPDELPITTLRVRNREGARIATEHLLAHGHSSVAFVSGPALGVSRARRDGWEAAHLACGARAGASTAQPFTFDGGARAATELLDLPEPPRAVLVSSDVQAIGFIRRAADRGIRVPADIALISFDGTDAGRHSVPSLTSLVQPVRAMAVEVIASLGAADSAVLHRVFDLPLRLAESCGCTPTNDREEHE